MQLRATRNGSPPSRGIATTFAAEGGRGVIGLSVRRVLIQSQVAAVLMVVADVGPHQPDQMTFAKDHDMLEELPTTAPDPAFRCAVLPGAAIRDAVWLRARRLEILMNSTTAALKIASRSKMRY